MMRIRNLLSERAFFDATIGGALCAMLLAAMVLWSVAARADVPPAPDVEADSVKVDAAKIEAPIDPETRGAVLRSLRHNWYPPYCSLARKGKTVLHVRLNHDGIVDSLQLLPGAAGAVGDNAAIAAANKGAPYKTSDGKPLEGWFEMEFDSNKSSGRCGELIGSIQIKRMNAPQTSPQVNAGKSPLSVVDSNMGRVTGRVIESRAAVRQKPEQR